MYRTCLSRLSVPLRASGLLANFRRQSLGISTPLRSLATTTDASDQITLSLPDSSFEVYECEPPASEVTVTKSELMAMYRNMTTVRRMEMAADGLYKSKLIRGFCHLCTGQEAVPVGMEHGITKEDIIITAYRCHGHTLMRGGTVAKILAELMGHRDGIAKGKGGSMHMFAPGFFGGNGIVGAQVPVGAGLSFVQNYLEQKACTFVMYGDGASNQGQVFEAFNMSKLWNLPTIYVCENNMYGMGTSAKRSSASTEYYKRAGYIPGIKVNGMDVLAVRQASAYAREYAISGNGPLLLEMATYRYGGHSMSDPGTTYRTREEIQHMRSRKDPITGLKQRLIENNVADEAQLKQIDKDVRAEIDKAIEVAKKGEEPDVSEIYKQIYFEGSEVFPVRGRDISEMYGV